MASCNLASAAATLDHLSGGRVRINIVSGQDDLAAYGDAEGDQAQRYARTREFMQLVRKLWTRERVSFSGEYFLVSNATVEPRLHPQGDRAHPKLYFGGASEAAERVAATEADVQLFWGEPIAEIAQRIARLRSLSNQLGREIAPLEFGLRITTLVRDTTENAWADAEAKVAAMAKNNGAGWHDHQNFVAVGQQRLLDLAKRGDVLDDNLYTAPGKVGGGGAGTTWLVGSAADAAQTMRNGAVDPRLRVRRRQHEAVPTERCGTPSDRSTILLGYRHAGNDPARSQLGKSRDVAPRDASIQTLADCDITEIDPVANDKSHGNRYWDQPAAKR